MAAPDDNPAIKTVESKRFILYILAGYEHDSPDEQGSGAGGAHALQPCPRQTCGGRPNQRQGQ